MDTETLTFDDGSWWEFLAYLSHGVKRKMEMASRPFFALAEPVSHGLKGEILGEPKYEIDWERWDPGPVNEAMLLHSTVAWSFGAVNQDTLDGIPDAKSTRVKSRMDELYAVPLVERIPSESPSGSTVP